MKKPPKLKAYMMNRILFGETILVICLLIAVVTMRHGKSTETVKEVQKTDTDTKDQDEDPVPPSPTQTLPSQKDKIPSSQESIEDEKESQKIEDEKEEKKLSLEVLERIKEDSIEGLILKTKGIRDVMYYLQTDSRWADLNYGENDTIQEFGCGPTSLSIVISTLTEYLVDPIQMSDLCYKEGYWYPQQGSRHEVILDICNLFGLSVTGYANEPGIVKKIENELKDGAMAIVLMGKGEFTQSGHFIVIRGMDEFGDIYIADPQNEENTKKPWELSRIVNEAKSWSGGEGPFWIIQKEKV